VEPTAFLSGKVALVTGSSRASGPPPRSCAKTGVDIVVNYRNKDHVPRE
jgi:hypothetical protein